VTPANVEKAEKAKKKRQSERSVNDYDSLENKKKRSLEKVQQETFALFFDREILDLVAAHMTVSLPELRVFLGVADGDVKKLFKNIKITPKNQLELYRKAYVHEQRWISGEYKARDMGCKKAVEGTLKPILASLEIELPEGFDEKVDEYITEALPTASKAEPEPTKEEDE
ncbi:MAG: hypothetical protein IMZ61_11085, partial [Planctomycetes bacterium]|nr:hypothetical protein [Planctomycetota bacterium]